MFRGPSSSRRAAVRGCAPDLLAQLLCCPSVRRNHARSTARQRPLQGRTFRARAPYRVRASERLVGGGDLPVGRGQNNFDIVRYEYYRDREVAFEGFTARSYLFREEFTSRIWATRYDFPALRDGRIKRDVISDDTPSGAQGWFFNTRREKFQDKRLREAFIYAFDFEWTNKMIMYGSYQRTHSVFQNSDMMAIGKPSAEYLALLESIRDNVHNEV